MNLPSRLDFHRAILLALATLAAFTTAAAQPPAGSGLPGIPTTPSRPGFAPGQLSILDSKGNPIGVCPLEHTDVQANLAGFVGRVHVKQEFRNLAKDPVEAVYTFPLPDNAAVDDLKMRIGDRLITADIKKREDARQIYDAARAAGQNAALLDQERANVFTQSVANIMPGQAITIEISFEQPIKYDSGYYEWTFPTVVGPRFTGGESGGPEPDKVTPPVTPDGLRAGHDLSITVNIEAGLPLREVKSELHAIDMRLPTRTSAVVKLRDAATIPNRDFILRYATAGDQVQSGVIALAPQNGDTGYFTLILQPPAAPPAADIAPKEMIFVIDQTGSQAGLPFQKARETINYCLQHLNPNDTFQLIGFNTEVFPCTPEPVPVTPENVAQAQAWLAALDAHGGTDVYKAMDYVLSQPGDAKRPRIVAVMTDGYIGNDTAIIQMIAEHRSLSRIFPFGIGNAVNRYLIDGMAREGRGAPDYVDLNADSKEIAEKFYQRISQPLLLDVAVDWGALPVSEVLPSHIPDVFSAAPITVTGRYAHGGQGIIKVSGLLRGQPWSQEIAVTLPDGPTANTEALRTIWAREKIADLEIESWKADMLARQAPPNARYLPNSDLKDKVTALALQYRLMSDYTSFVAVEQRIVNVGGQEKTVNVPVDMADGVSYQNTVGGLTKIGTGSLGLRTGSAYRGAPGGFGAGGAGQGGGGFGGGVGGRRGGAGGGGGAIGRGGFGGGGQAAGAAPASGAAPRPDSTSSTVDNGDPMAKTRWRNSKLAESLRQLPETFASEGKDGALNKPGLPVVTKGRVEVQIWLNALPDDGIKQLTTAGFDLAATLTPGKLLLGTADVAKLDDLIALGFVRLVEPPDYK